MTVYEYLQLKKQYQKAKQSLSRSFTNEKQATLKSLEKKIKTTEKTKEIAEYLRRKAAYKRTLMQVASLKRYGKDTAKFEETLAKLKEDIDKDENPDTPTQQPDKPLKPAPDSTYYIINLAWSREDGFVINTVREYINTFNYVQSYQERNAERNENMITWMFYYDTTEEQAMIKSLRVCASHLLDILKSRYPGQTDAEVFGKVQKY